MTTMVPAIRERRAAPRTRTVREHGIEQARIRPGREAAVIDVSAGGILIDTHHRLLPGTTIELQLSIGDACTAVRGRVLRSAVACLRHGRVLYRGAIAFDHPLASVSGLDGYAVPARTTDHHHRREDATRPTR
jgi:hypothetical protein